jgi:hypothetical protein
MTAGCYMTCMRSSGTARVVRVWIGWCVCGALAVGSFLRATASDQAVVTPTCPQWGNDIMCLPPPSCTFKRLDGPYQWCVTVFEGGTPWCCVTQCWRFRCDSNLQVCSGSVGTYWENVSGPTSHRGCNHSTQQCGTYPAAECVDVPIVTAQRRVVEAHFDKSKVSPSLDRNEPLAAGVADRAGGGTGDAYP